MPNPYYQTTANTPVRLLQSVTNKDTSLKLRAVLTVSILLTITIASVTKNAFKEKDGEEDTVHKLNHYLKQVRSPIMNKHESYLIFKGLINMEEFKSRITTRGWLNIDLNTRISKDGYIRLL